MRRIAVALLCALVIAPLAIVDAARPLHIKLEPGGSFVVTGACTFGVEFTDLTVHGNLLEFVDKSGEFKKTIIAGHFVTRAINLETGRALTLNNSGQFVFTPNPDGSMTLDAHGRNIFFTVDPEPFVEFHRGRAVLTVTVSGEMMALVFNELSGQSDDICQALTEPL